MEKLAQLFPPEIFDSLQIDEFKNEKIEVMLKSLLVRRMEPKRMRMVIFPTSRELKRKLKMEGSGTPRVWRGYPDPRP